jgi:hypothetical protein
MQLVTCRYNPEPADNAVGWLAVVKRFDPTNGNQYEVGDAAVVTEECWNGIKRHLAEAMPDAARGTGPLRP